MKYLKELLLLKQIRGIGKQRINTKYLQFIESGIEEVLRGERSEMELSLAKERADALYEKIIGCNALTAITIFDEEYPEPLKIMKAKTPPIIYVRGNASVIRGIAVVGTRQPSEHSVKVERKLVKKILDISTDATIISGLAIGCDKIAHEVTVENKRRTVAVLPSGVMNVTPASHRELAERILQEDGCLLSEYEPWEGANRYTFVDRDAVIAAMSEGVIAIECSKKSGTMHTVDAGVEYGRKIGCYMPKDMALGEYDGNVDMVERKGAVPLYDTEELSEFLRSSSSDVVSGELI